MNSKKKIIISVLSLITIIILSILLYPIYNKIQLKRLIEVSNTLFEEYIEKGEKSYLNKNMKAEYKPTETVIVAGNNKEFVSQIFYEVNIDVDGEKDFVSSQHTMKIKKVKHNEYEVVEEGKDVSIENLNFLYFSSKNNDRINKVIDDVENSDNNKTSAVEYSADANHISLSYDSGKSFVEVPIPKDYILSNVEEPYFENPSDAPPIIEPLLKENTFYLSHDKTAFISTNQSDILITISDDNGKSFYDYKLKDAYQGGDLYIGFSSKDVGYFAHTTDVAMGTQYNYIYITTDGGKTFNEIGNTNEVYHRVVTGLGFIDDKIGLVGFRYESDNNPTVYRTDDSGITWNKLELNLPYEYSSDYATPLSPKFKDDMIVLPVKLRDNNVTINFVSSDKGVTWEYSSN